MLFVFQCSPVGNFGKLIKFEPAALSGVKGLKVKTTLRCKTNSDRGKYFSNSIGPSSKFQPRSTGNVWFQGGGVG